MSPWPGIHTEAEDHPEPADWWQGDDGLLHCCHPAEPACTCGQTRSETP